MPYFNSFNGLPVTANLWLLKNILCDEWNFKGIVVTDYNAINELITHGVAEDVKTVAKLAF